MASAADRFSTLQKVAIFLIVMGPEKAREILEGVDVTTLQRLNATIEELGDLTAAEKAAVMIEFGDFFYKGKELLPLQKRPEKKRAKPPPKSAKPAKSSALKEKSAPAKAETTTSGAPQAEAKFEVSDPKSDEKIVISALKKLRERVDPKKIDWSKAGYDFGEGFKGPPEERR
jgi:hypothetical protein